ncbi:MAG: tyrosine-type recombinase/integrase [Chloroflexi bacterium]|nr:tyrosine-type recombinase/integrase [Chloroflexota bacterium]
MFPQTDIDEFRRYWRRRKPGTSTALHYASDVTIFFKWTAELSPETITVHDVDRFIEWQCHLGRRPTTIRRRIIALRMFYDFLAYLHDRPIPNPVIGHRHYVDCGSPLPRAVTDEVLQGLFTALKPHLRDRTIFTLMLHAGLRVGEVVNLGVADVQLASGRTPQLRLNGKGQRERIVYLSATAAECLREYLATRLFGNDTRVFLNRRGQPITITGIQLQLAKYCRQANIWITCHQLRHTFASRLLAADVPVTSIQKLLGHRSLRTTQRYIQVADSQVERDYRAGIQKVLADTSSKSGGTR